jgi:hypothetical protein
VIICEEIFLKEEEVNMKCFQIRAAAPVLLAIGIVLLSPAGAAAKRPNLVRVQTFKGKVKRTADVVAVNIPMARYEPGPSRPGVSITPVLNLTFLSSIDGVSITRWIKVQKLVDVPAVYLLAPGEHTLEFSNVFEAHEVRSSGGQSSYGGGLESFSSRQEYTYRHETKQPFRVKVDARAGDEYNIESMMVGYACHLTVLKGSEVVSRTELK